MSDYQSQKTELQIAIEKVLKEAADKGVKTEVEFRSLKGFDDRPERIYFKIKCSPPRD